MRTLLPLTLFSALALTQGAFAQQDPGKEVVGKIKVEVFHGTNEQNVDLGKNAKAVPTEITQRLQREQSTNFKTYALLGSDIKELFRSYENWAEPVKPSDEIMVRFEAQSAPGADNATLDLELWLGRKKIVKTDVKLTANKPLWVRGPTWRQGHLIIAVSMLPVKSK